MGLAEVLSAVRELVLDNNVPAGSPEQRSLALRRRFAQLTAKEAVELANASPERFRLYTELVFSGERSVLHWVFPVSIAVIVRLTQAAGDDRHERDIEYDLVREVYKHQPWQRSTTLESAAYFESFVGRRFDDLTAVWPGLLELVDFERTMLEVFHAKDVLTTSVSGETLSEMTRDELMSTVVRRPEHVVVSSYHYDVFGVAECWKETKTLPTELPPPSPCFAVCSRASANMVPRWIRLNPQSHAAISVLDDVKSVDIGALWSAYCECSSDVEEPIAYDRFVSDLKSWVDVGVIVGDV